LQRTFAKLFFVLAVPVVFVGLIDPLEGGLALVVAALLYLAGFGLAKTLPARSLWIPFLIAVLIGVVTIRLALSGLGRQGPYEPTSPIVLVGVWAYRAAVLATLVGAVINAIAFLVGRR